MVAGCIPFNPDHPTALFTPHTWQHYNTGWLELQRRDVGDAQTPNEQTSISDSPQSWQEIPSPQEHIARVASAVERIERGDMDKVVLARSLTTRFRQPLSVIRMLDRLVTADHDGRGFLASLDAAGGCYANTHIVGSSPEILITRRGSRIFTYPLAGTAARRLDNRDADRHTALALQNSSKDLDEHRFVVEAIEEALQPWCHELDVPPLPTLTHTDHVWHLGTPIRGTLASTETTALELALALHPTPAVAGTPRAEAMQHIREVEGERGFYAGAVGWSDASGDGHWRVLLRAGHLSDGGQTMTMHAGGGIVADSDPEHELAETYLKFSPMLSALGSGHWLQEHIGLSPVAGG